MGDGELKTRYNIEKALSFYVYLIIILTISYVTCSILIMVPGVGDTKYLVPMMFVIGLMFLLYFSVKSFPGSLWQASRNGRRLIGLTYMRVDFFVFVFVLIPFILLLFLWGGRPYRDSLTLGVIAFEFSAGVWAEFEFLWRVLRIYSSFARFDDDKSC